MSTGIVWFRRDLRLHTNPAWTAATRRHDAVVPLFVIDPALWDGVTERRRAMLAGHLQSLDDELRARGGRLRVERGDPADVIPAVVASTGADDVTANADVTPYAKKRDAAVERTVDLDLHHGTLVHAPGTILTGDGRRYRVFTPFSRTWLQTPIRHPPPPGDAVVAGEPGRGIPTTAPPPMAPGEEAALARLAAFDPAHYPAGRDRPDRAATSRLSVDLKYGTLSPITVVDQVGHRTEGARAFVRQLAWRDYYAHLLDEIPSLTQHALRPAYDRIAWRDDHEGFTAWTRGMTGYPFVDAGMRQLRAEGWISNRVRMITASFLIKDLLIDWRRGERWFRRQLLDGDVAQNVGNWQWVAGTGPDAAPYFRVFNPVTQSKTSDPGGDWIRRWVPELATVPTEFVHEPWKAGGLARAMWGADGYPPPIVDHADARLRTIDAYQRALGSSEI